MRIRRLLALIFGIWTWEAPGWLAWMGTRLGRGARAIVAHPLRAALLALTGVSAPGGAAWCLARPKPHYVTYAITEPGLTEYNANGISAIKALTIVFSESAAPLKQIKTAITSGVDLSPSLPGTWFWVSDTELRFTPKDD